MTQTNESPTIILTEKAAKEIMSIMAENEFDHTKAFLRVGVKGGGC